MANSMVYDPLRRNSSMRVAAAGDGAAVAAFNSQGIAQIDITDANLLRTVKAAGGAVVDKAGTEEALTAGTVQTATTMSAVVMRNGAGATVLNFRVLNDSGNILIGPITIGANKERVIVFPTQMGGFTGGVYVEEVSGGLNATPGFLIP